MATITNQSYFIKRLKDSGYVVWKNFEDYNEADSRCWTVIIDPKVSSIFCTYYQNSGTFGNENFFELYDGGRYIPSNIKIKTDSIEVIIDFLLRHGVSNNKDYPGRDRYLSKRLNTYDEK